MVAMGATVVMVVMVAMVEAALATTMPAMVVTAMVDTGVMVHMVASGTFMGECWILLTFGRMDVATD